MELRDTAEATAALAEEGPIAMTELEAPTSDELLDRSIQAGTRWLLAETAIPALLRPKSGPLAGCDLHLYVYDADERKLLPIFESEEDTIEAQGWEPGRGVTGAAWSMRELIMAAGAETHDGSYGLTAAERDRYAELAAVAATPVVDDNDDAIAVLAASTENDDQGEALVSLEGAEAMLSLAATVARVFSDVLDWHPAADG